jgi:hypothetical protein
MIVRTRLFAYRSNPTSRKNNALFINQMQKKHKTAHIIVSRTERELNILNSDTSLSYYISKVKLISSQ